MIKDLQEYIDAERKRSTVNIAAGILLTIVAGALLMFIPTPANILACWIPFFAMVGIAERGDIQKKLQKNLIRDAKEGFYIPVECMPNSSREITKELLWFFGKIGADIRLLDVFERKYTGDNMLYSGSYLWYVRYHGT